MASPASHRATAAAFTPGNLTSNAAFLVASVHALLATKAGTGSDYTDAENYLGQAEALLNTNGREDARSSERMALRAQVSAFLAS